MPFLVNLSNTNLPNRLDLLRSKGDLSGKSGRITPNSHKTKSRDLPILGAVEQRSQSKRFVDAIGERGGWTDHHWPLVESLQSN